MERWQVLEEILCEGTVELTAVTGDGKAYGVSSADEAIPEPGTALSLNAPFDRGVCVMGL